MADKELRTPLANADGADHEDVSRTSSTELKTADADSLPSTDSAEPTALSTAETERGLGRSMLVKVALATVLVASLIISIANLMVANQLRDQTDEYEAEIAAYKEKISRLKYYINKEADDDYIVEYAREYLDMYFPDEEVYYNDVNK